MYKTAISNICWGNIDDNVFLEKAASCGAYGIEVAPSVMWQEPVHTNLKDRKTYRAHVEKFGLKIISLHALFYTRPDLSIFGDSKIKKLTGTYIVELARLANDLGARVMIMGSPKNRRRGEITKDKALEETAEFFYDIAKRLEPYKTVLCIEPLAEDEADFINSHIEALDLVKEVNHPSFEMMLDIKSMFKTGVDYYKAFQESAKHIKHIHVNDPGNMVPGTNGVDHKLVAKALKTIQYDNILSLEIGRSVATPMKNLEDGFKVLNRLYCGS